MLSYIQDFLEFAKFTALHFESFDVETPIFQLVESSLWNDRYHVESEAFKVAKINHDLINDFLGLLFCIQLMDIHIES